MRGRTGTSTIYTTILPKQSYLDRICTKKLSKVARHRLKMIDFFFLKADKNVSLTARHFGVTRGYVYKWLNRFNPKYLESLEDKSRKPHRIREPQYDWEVIALVRKYREDKDTCAFSAKKLAAIIKEDYPNTKFCVSAATIGRIIKKFHLFFHRIKQYTKKRVKAVKYWNKYKKRRPAGLKATKPREIIEFDMKHIYACNRKYYAMCSIDPVAKEAYLHLSRTSTSHQAKIALEDTIKIFGKDIAILNDNGSENKGEAWDFLEEQEIVQYFAHPKSPKEKPFVERFIGSLQRECLDVHKEDIVTEEDLIYYVNRWLNNYHFLRPHQSLNYQTPAAYCAKMGITIYRREVYMM